MIAVIRGYVYTNNAGDLTLEGVLDGTIIIAESIETSNLSTDSMQVEMTGGAAIAGQGTFKDGTTTADIKTTAITSKSLVFVTPYNDLAQSLAVSQINCDEDDENCTGFMVSRTETDKELLFNWFIVNDK